MFRNKKTSEGIIFIAIIILSGTYGIHAENSPVTLEMLTTLRAAETVNAAHDPGCGIATFEGLHATSLEFQEDNAHVMAAENAIKKAFNIQLCHESYPMWLPHPASFMTNYKFGYTVYANERLIDALNKLTEATAGNVLWRLLDGKIILTAEPEDIRADVPLIGERRVNVAIEAPSIYEAFLQLENQYNKQYTDFAFLVKPPHSDNVATADASPDVQKSECFLLQREDTIRNIILELLRQTGMPDANYTLSVSRINAKDALPENFYDSDIFHYSLLFNIPSCEGGASAEKINNDMSSETDLTWLLAEFEKKRLRLREYYLRNYPEIAGTTVDDQ